MTALSAASTKSPTVAVMGLATLTLGSASAGLVPVVATNQAEAATEGGTTMVIKSVCRRIAFLFSA